VAVVEPFLTLPMDDQVVLEVVALQQQAVQETLHLHLHLKEIMAVEIHLQEHSRLQAAVVVLEQLVVMPTIHQETIVVAQVALEQKVQLADLPYFMLVVAAVELVLQ
jgi:hypothetical protein